MHDWIYVRTREWKAAGRPSVGYQKVITVRTRNAELYAFLLRKCLLKQNSVKVSSLLKSKLIKKHKRRAEK